MKNSMDGGGCHLHTTTQTIKRNTCSTDRFNCTLQSTSTIYESSEIRQVRNNRLDFSYTDCSTTIAMLNALDEWSPATTNKAKKPTNRIQHRIRNQSHDIILLPTTESTFNYVNNRLAGLFSVNPGKNENLLCKNSSQKQKTVLEKYGIDQYEKWKT